MDIKALTPELLVAAQIAAALAVVAERGFRSDICNRPDGEGAGQPLVAERERAAQSHGLQMRYLPAESGKVTHVDSPGYKATFSVARADGNKEFVTGQFNLLHAVPPLYWYGMRKGREWLAQPEMVG